MPSANALITNTGPLLGLYAAVGSLQPLRVLFPRVIVPFEVNLEMFAGGKTKFGVDLYRADSWLEKRGSPTRILPTVGTRADPGEVAVISLAITERIADVCLDDLDARRLARILGLRVTGSIGVLLAAKSEGEPIEIRRALDNMRRQGIWISDNLMRQALLAAGE
jgi:predicted nucleic acid-binding protein